MSRQLARAVISVAVTFIGDPDTRVRYREQWLADVDGAADLGLPVVPLALGAATAAVRIAVTDPRCVTALLRAPLLPRVGGGIRRAYGALQLLVAAPYLWAGLFYLSAVGRLGVSGDPLFTGGNDPKDLLGVTPLDLYYTPVMLWMAAGGWVVAVALAPVGLLLSLGGRGTGRWLPVAGTGAAVAVTAFATSGFGEALRVWLLD